MKSDNEFPRWRAATTSDLDLIQRIGDEIHITLPERAEVFAEKFQLFPEGCLVLVLHDEVVGYGLSHPWLLRSIPPLDTFLGMLPQAPECVFIHDVVVLHRARGRGAAGAFIDIIKAIARKANIPYLALVSVYNTHPLWERLGFQIILDPRLSDKLTSYGATARYMTCRLN